jgi:polyhydroxyalkanoate synthesis regulator phasin
MFELIEKAFLTGIGALAVSQKMGEEFVADLKERYKMSEDEGKAVLEKMQCFAKEGREKVAEIAEIEVRKVMDKIGMVPREDYERLLKRLEELEKRMDAE